MKKYSPRTFVKVRTAEQIRQRRQHAFSVRPWTLATGPRTAAGKKKAGKNNLRHGHRSRTVIEFKRFLHVHCGFSFRLLKKTLVVDFKWDWQTRSFDIKFKSPFRKLFIQFQKFQREKY